MLLRKLTAAAAMLAMITVPVAAQARSAERVSEPVAAQSELGRSSILLLAAAIAAFGTAVLFLTDKDDDEPVSA